MAISLSSISRTQRNALPPRVFMHSLEKVGKSTFAANAINPIFLPTEDGLSGLEVNAFPQLYTYDDVMQALDSLRKGEHDFGTAVLDTVDWFEPMVWRKVCDAYGVDNIEKVLGGFGKGYIAADQYWKDFIDACERLRRERSMVIILLAHSQVTNITPPDSESYSKYTPKLHKRAAAILEEWADVIAHAREEVTVKKEQLGFSKSRTRGVGSGNRVMHCNKTPAYTAGNRYGLPDVLPLDFNAMLNAMALEPAAQAA